jgi:predicted RNA-binding Zn-ribbon protein involved in translation (DUF1610 family)
MHQKAELDRRVALELNMSNRDVSVITASFIRQIGSMLIENGYVVIDNLGVLRVYLTKKAGEAYLTNGGPNRRGVKTGRRRVELSSLIRVGFSKAKVLRRELAEHYKEEAMEKYGVDESTGTDQEQLEKQAAKGCPDCGGKVTKHGKVLMCANCGTKPFEQKDGSG